MKKLISILFLVSALAGQAADVKVSELPAATAPTGAESIPVVQGGTTKKMPVSALARSTNGSTFNTFTNSTPGMTNSGSYLHNGSLWLPPASFDGSGNNFGGSINWFGYNQTVANYQEGVGSSPLAKISHFPNWGGASQTYGATLLVTAHSIRIENALASPADLGYISIGNEDRSGDIFFNNNPVTPTRNGVSTNGQSIPIGWQAVGYDANTNRFYAKPGIVSWAVQNAPLHGPGGNQSHEGELWLCSYVGYSRLDSDFFTYPPVPVLKVKTNSVAVVGSGGLDVSTGYTYLRGGGYVGGGGLVVTGTVYVGESADLSAPGLDVASGAAPGIVVGADVNYTTRVSGAPKAFGIAMCAKTNGNTRPLILSGSFLDNYPELYFGGGSGSYGCFAGLNFYAGATPHTAGGGTLQLRIMDGAIDVRTRFRVAGTVTAAGTTTPQTINKSSGIVNMAATTSTVTVTNNYVTADSVVFAVVQSNDTTAQLKNVVPANGSFTVNLTANTTAETRIGFFVVIPN